MRFLYKSTRHVYQKNVKSIKLKIKYQRRLFMSIDNNMRYQNVSKNLYNLLIRKYDVRKGEYSIQNLKAVGYLIGHRQNKITYDDGDKILNICLTLDRVVNGNEVTQEELEGLERLYEYFTVLDKDQQSKTSSLEEHFSKLSIQSKDAIVNENEFDEFKKYMHIKREIENEFEKILEEKLVTETKSILFIVGNVGDGKSHLLSYMMDKHPTTFSKKNIKIHNDATESDSPKSTAFETMKRVLQPFADDNLNNDSDDRLVVAINLGVLTSLIQELDLDGNYTTVVNYLRESKILSSRDLANNHHKIFNIISFTEQLNFNLGNGKIESDFYETALKKVFSTSLDNPFYQAYLKDKDQGMNKLLHVNYEYMLREDFQKTIVYLLVRAEIEYKIIISARMLFNFFFDITVPRDNKSRYNSYLPYLLFENSARSELLNLISTLDPIKNQTRKIDEVSIELYHAPDTLKKISELFEDDYRDFSVIYESFKEKQEKFDDFINTYLRLKFLMNYEDGLFNHSLFSQYLKQSSEIKAGRQDIELFEVVDQAFSKWNGNSGTDGLIIKNPGKGSVKILVEIDLEPEEVYIKGTSIALIFTTNQEQYELIVDYRTYEILTKINNGYFLKEEDRQIAINFDMFVTSLLNSVKVMNKNILLDLKTNQQFELKKSMKKIILKKGKR